MSETSPFTPNWRFPARAANLSIQVPPPPRNLPRANANGARNTAPVREINRSSTDSTKSDATVASPTSTTSSSTDYEFAPLSAVGAPAGLQYMSGPACRRASLLQPVGEDEDDQDQSPASARSQERMRSSKGYNVIILLSSYSSPLC
ncbi:hypothetical protein BOTBODRAFT_128487 [Botryobasidium botryosum FD-172 SS1]|uniref:Uncharacterized protein n=1 Tax=Botryobasidium botryosum (strain FD-172 SS1) TaxID=930990 RepID=A0A067N162_BOTB1|nr:hypothetical protein BOTBODRAFT_128487 [Botryobasidium botryosum FD-172 SS1]